MYIVQRLTLVQGLMALKALIKSVLNQDMLRLLQSLTRNLVSLCGIQKKKGKKQELHKKIVDSN